MRERGERGGSERERRERGRVRERGGSERKRRERGRRE